MYPKPRKSISVSVLLFLAAASAARASTTIVLQQGVNGYAGQVDTGLGAGYNTTDRGNGGTDLIFTDYPDGSSDPVQEGAHELIRFDGIPLGATILSATLTVMTGTDANSPGNGGTYYRMLQPWNGATTWSNWTNGISPDGVNASTTASFQTTGKQSAGSILTFNATADVQAWSNGQADYGWVGLPMTNGTDGWGIYDASWYIASQRPMLTITYAASTKQDVWTDHSNDHLFNTTSINWSSANNNIAYPNGDYVVFNDSAGAGHYDVSFSGMVNPSGVIVNNAAGNYVFSGVGGVGAQNGATLAKLGSGKLTLSTASSHNFSGGVSVYQGTVIVDLNAIASHTNALASTTDLLLGGGTLQVNGSSGNNGSQTFTGVQLTSGDSSVVLNPNGGSVTLTFSSFIRVSGATIDFATPPAGSVINASFPSVQGFQTFNHTDWVFSTGGGVTPGPISPLTAYTNDAWSTTNDTNVTTNHTFTSSSTTNSLRYNNSSDTTLTFSSVNGTLTSGGVLMTANVGAHNNTISGGSLGIADYQDLIVHQYDLLGVMTISSTIYNASPGYNGSGTGQMGLTVVGGGKVVVSGANLYSGIVTINGGFLSVPSIPNGGVNGPLGNSSNAAANLVFNQGTLQYTGSTASTDRLLTLGPGGGAIDGSGSGGLTFSNTGAIAFAQDCPATLTLTGTANSNTLNPSIADPDASSTYTTAVTKSGTGTWILNRANTYTGGTAVNGGSLVLAASGASGPGPISVNNIGSALLVNSGVTVAGALTANGGFISLAGIAGAAISLQNASTLSVASSAAINALITADHSLIILNSPVIAGSASVIGGSITGNGVITGSSNLTGNSHLAPQTVLQLNTLSFASGTQLDVTLAPSGGGIVNAPTSLTMNAGLQVNATAGASFGVGSFNLFLYNHVLNDNSNHFQNWIANVNWPSAPANTYYTFALNGSSKVVNLVVGTAAGVYPLDSTGVPTGIPVSPSGASAVPLLNIGSGGWIVGAVNTTGSAQTWNFAQSAVPEGIVYRNGGAVIATAPLSVIVPNKPGPGLFVGAYPVQSAPVAVSTLDPNGTAATVNAQINSESVGLAWMNANLHWVAAVDGNFYLGNGSDPLLGNVLAGFSANHYTGYDPQSASTILGAPTSREVNLTLDNYINLVFGPTYDSTNLTEAQWTALDGAWGGAPDLTVDPTGNTYRFWAVVDYDAQFAVAVPEPAALSVLGLAMAGLFFRRRPRRHRAQLDSNQ